jgi:hypothetical protein
MVPVTEVPMALIVQSFWMEKKGQKEIAEINVVG